MPRAGRNSIPMSEVGKVDCPQCGQRAGTMCISTDPRIVYNCRLLTYHNARIRAAKEKRDA